MSVKVMSLVWQRATDIQGNDLVVLLALADWSNDAGVCWPSVPTLAAKSRVSERTVRYILTRLTEAGYIQVDEQRGRNHTNHYLINMQRLQVLDGEKVQPLQVIEPENLQSTTENLQVTTLKPAIAIAPEPSIDTSLKEPSERRARLSHFPDDFAITPKLRQKAKDEGWTQWIDIDKHTRDFIEYWTIGEGSGVKKKNWDLTWQGWMRRDAESAQRKGLRFGGNNGNSQGQVSTYQQSGPKPLAFPKVARPPRKIG